MKRKLTCVAAALLLLITPAFAGDLSTSTIGAGIKAMIQDLTLYLTILSPLIGALFAGYFIMRRAGADEQDGKMWTKRIYTAIGCGVAGMLVSGLISVISGYFI